MTNVTHYDLNTVVNIYTKHVFELRKEFREMSAKQLCEVLESFKDKLSQDNADMLDYTIFELKRRLKA